MQAAHRWLYDRRADRNQKALAVRIDIIAAKRAGDYVRMLQVEQLMSGARTETIARLDIRRHHLQDARILGQV